jgi:hypothetical protein
MNIKVSLFSFFSLLFLATTASLQAWPMMEEGKKTENKKGNVSPRTNDRPFEYDEKKREQTTTIL